MYFEFNVKGFVIVPAHGRVLTLVLSPENHTCSQAQPIRIEPPNRFSRGPEIR